MGLFLITVKQHNYTNGIKLEKGMTVEVTSSNSSPMTTRDDQMKIQDAFMRKYGLDIKKNGGISVVYLDIKKIS